MNDNRRKVFNKRNPSESGGVFTPLPADAYHYVHHPDMRPNMLILYALIIDYYNVEEGFAYPSLERLSVDYGMSYNATSKHIETLKAVGLIDYPEKGYYVPLEPLSKAEFYAEFPEAWQAYKKALEQAEGKRESDRKRLREWRANKVDDRQ